MNASRRDKKASMSSLLSDVVDRMLRLQPVAGDQRSDSLARKQVNIRAASVREGFQAMRARSDEMAQRLQHYRRRQAASEPTSIEDDLAAKIAMHQPSSKN